MQTENSGLENTAQIDVKEFIKASSFTGLMALYIIFLSLNKRKGFNIINLCANLNFLSVENFKGYTNALSTKGISIFTYNTSEKGAIINTLTLHSFIEKNIKAEIAERAKSYDSTKDQDWLSRYSWLKQVKTIEDYFGS